MKDAAFREAVESAKELRAVREGEQLYNVVMYTSREEYEADSPTRRRNDVTAQQAMKEQHEFLVDYGVCICEVEKVTRKNPKPSPSVIEFDGNEWWLAVENRGDHLILMCNGYYVAYIDVEEGVMRTVGHLSRNLCVCICEVLGLTLDKNDSIVVKRDSEV